LPCGDKFGEFLHNRVGDRVTEGQTNGVDYNMPTFYLFIYFFKKLGDNLMFIFYHLLLEAINNVKAFEICLGCICTSVESIM